MIPKSSYRPGGMKRELKQGLFGTIGGWIMLGSWLVLIQVLSGQGIDRHLLGLQLIAVENSLPVPSFLTDTDVTKTRTWRLSTSQVRVRVYNRQICIN